MAHYRLWLSLKADFYLEEGFLWSKVRWYFEDKPAGLNCFSVFTRDFRCSTVLLVLLLIDLCV